MTDDRHDDPAADTDPQGRLEALIGQCLQSREVWVTVSPTGNQPHDEEEQPHLAVRAFCARTGIDWHEAHSIGWRLVRAWRRYQVTGAVIE